MKKSILKIGRNLIITILLLTLAFCAGRIYENESIGNRAAIALLRTGLPTVYAPDYSLYGFTGLRDSFSQTVFLVEYNQQDLLNAIQKAEHWTVAPVSAEDFRSFVSHTWYPDISQVSNDIVFDAWYYVETTESTDAFHHQATGALEAIGALGRGFEFAVFDIETGLFIFIDQFG